MQIYKCYVLLSSIRLQRSMDCCSCSITWNQVTVNISKLKNCRKKFSNLFCIFFPMFPILVSWVPVEHIEYLWLWRSFWGHSKKKIEKYNLENSVIQTQPLLRLWFFFNQAVTVVPFDSDSKGYVLEFWHLNFKKKSFKLNIGNLKWKLRLVAIRDLEGCVCASGTYIFECAAFKVIWGYMVQLRCF